LRGNISSLDGENRFLRIAGVYLQDQPGSRPKKPQPGIFRQNAVLQHPVTFIIRRYSVEYLDIFRQTVNMFKTNSETKVGDQ